MQFHKKSKRFYKGHNHEIQGFDDDEDDERNYSKKGVYKHS